MNHFKCFDPFYLKCQIGSSTNGNGIEINSKKLKFEVHQDFKFKLKTLKFQIYFKKLK